MKKILSLLIVFIFIAMPVFAKKTVDEHYINFSGKKYRLLYSSKNPETGGYLNEYYTRGESYNLWSELVGIHHFPNAYSPIDQVKAFREYLGTLNCPSALTFDDKNNTAIIDFIMISPLKNSTVIEFNVFKYEKSKKCGSVALQYAKRYQTVTAFQLEDVKRDIEKSRQKILKAVKKYEIPYIVTEEIDKCKIETPVETVPEVKKEEIKQKTDIPVESVKDEASVESNSVEKVDTEVKYSDNNAEIKEEVKNTKELKKEEDNVVPVTDKVEKPEKQINEPEKLKEEVNEESKKESGEEVKQEILNNANSVEEKSENILQKTDANKEQDTEIKEAKNEPKEQAKPVKPKEDIVKESEKTMQSDKDEVAPIPQELINPKKNKAKNKKQKHQKFYMIIDDKEEYLAKPLTKKEYKQIRKEAKLSKKPYTVVNDKDSYIAKPLSKKEIKAQVKAAKKRAKEASRKLHESL